MLIAALTRLFSVIFEFYDYYCLQWTNSINCFLFEKNICTNRNRYF